MRNEMFPQAAEFCFILYVLIFNSTCSLHDEKLLIIIYYNKLLIRHISSPELHNHSPASISQINDSFCLFIGSLFQLHSEKLHPERLQCSVTCVCECVRLTRCPSPGAPWRVSWRPGSGPASGDLRGAASSGRSAPSSRGAPCRTDPPCVSDGGGVRGGVRGGDNTHSQ